MILKDYIFYRMNLYYLKHEGSGRISAILFVSAIESFLLIPFLGFLVEMGKIKGDIIYYIFGLPTIGIVANNIRRYYAKERTKALIKKYKNNPCNKNIKDWVFLLVIPFIICWFFIGLGTAIFLAKKLLA